MPPQRARSSRANSRLKAFVVVGLAALSATVLIVGVWIFLSERRGPRTATRLPAEPAPRQRRADLTEQFLARVGLAVQAKQYDQAVRAMREFLQSQPNEPRVLELLAMTLMEQGDAAAGEQEVDALLAAQPQHRMGHWMKGELLRMRGAGGFLEHFRRAAQGADDADLLVRLGGSYLACGELDAAAECFGKVLAVQPTRPDALAGLAQTYYEDGQYEQSERLLERLAALQADNPLLAAMLGRVRMLQGDYAGSRAAYERIRTTGAGAMGLAEVHAMMAADSLDAAEKTAQYEQAVHWAEQAIAFAGTRLDGHYTVARTLYVMGGEENYRRALEHLKTAGELAPGDGRLADLARKVRDALAVATFSLTPAGASWTAPPDEPASQPSDAPAPLDFKLR